MLNSNVLAVIDRLTRGSKDISLSETAFKIDLRVVNPSLET